MQGNKTRFYMIFAGLSAAFFLAAGATFASLGVVLPAMIETLNWSWAEAGLGFTTLALFTGLFSPAFTLTLKFIGVRNSYGLGAGAMAAGFFLLAAMDTLAVYIGAAALLGAGFALIANVPSTYVIGEWIKPQSRGAIVGVYLAIGGLGGVAGPLAAQYCLDAGLDWRLFWTAAGVAMLVVGGYLVAVLNVSPGAAAAQAQTSRDEAEAEDEPTPRLREAMMSPAFIAISACLFVAYFCGVTVNAWAVTHLQGAGVAAGIAASALSLHAAANTGARAFGAVIIRRLTPRALLISGLVSEAVGMALLAAAHDPLSAFAFAAFEGYAFGMILFATTMLQLQFFGHKNTPALLGAMNLAATAAMIGPLLTGYVGDRTGSFASIFIACAVAAGALAVLIGYLKPPASRAPREPIAAAAPYLKRRAKKWNPVFRQPGATTKKTIASGDPDLSPDVIEGE